MSIVSGLPSAFGASLPWAVARSGLLSLWLICAGCEDASDSAEVPAAAGGRLSVAEALGEGAVTAAFAQASPDRALSFPQDHGPHPSFRSEWWYLTLMLSDDSGAAYGGQFTLFRQGLSPGASSSESMPPDANPWRADQLYLGHLAMTDAAGGEHRFAERFSRGVQSLAGARAQPFAVWLEDWRLESVGADFLPLTLAAAGDDFRWDLRLVADKGRVLQGANGFSPKGPAQASHYYSYPRLAVSGVLERDGVPVAVTGGGWLDREWSTSVLSAGQIGWAWFALQLDDGRDLMLFALRRDDCSRDPFDHGLAVAATGDSRYLAADAFVLMPMERWRPSAGAKWLPVDGCNEPGWPLAWRVEVEGETFVVRAAVSDQRMDTTIRYWEGLVFVEDPATGARVGRGYLELTGYAD